MTYQQRPPWDIRRYQRFTRPQIIEHWILFASFTILALTGISQKFVGRGWAEGLIGLMGGIENVRRWHHVAAVVLLLECIYHVVAMAYRIYVLRVRLSMLPTLNDVTDFLDMVRYNLGLAKQRPRLDRYSYEEKFEYWAVVWGTLIMVVTGFMMWNPITVTRFLPGEVIPMAKAAHGSEALLAILAIITWHVYNVHIKRFNESMFTGYLNEREMAHEHPLELERITRGDSWPAVSREVKRQRERKFMPVAVVVVILLLGSLFAFVNAEETAITTLPERATVVAYLPATATPTPIPTRTPTLEPTDTPAPTITPVPGATHVPTPEPTKMAPKAIPHPLESRENCLLCHGEGMIKPFPADHAGRSNETCLNCHAEQSKEAVVEPTATPEPLAAAPGFASDILPIFQEKCALCHGTTAGLNLTDYDSMMQGGDSGSPIVPGDPDASLLVQKQRGQHPAKLTEGELQLIVNWIAAGAPN